MKNRWWFLHLSSPVLWRTDDPAEWCLTHRQASVLEPVRRELGAADVDRAALADLVVRRCPVNLLGFDGARLVVRHGTLAPHAALRLFIRRELRGWNVADLDFHDVETGRRTAGTLATLRVGVPLPDDWPVAALEEKLYWRNVTEADDDELVPISGAGFVDPAPDAPPLRWSRLKQMWTKSLPRPCPDCDQPAFFVFRGCALAASRPGRVEPHHHLFVCLQCRCLYVRDVLGNRWIEQRDDASTASS